jgi:dTDP-glucose 4,6-dehydratase
MRMLITGAAGFIGSNFVHHLIREHPDDEITVLDKLTYAGRKENLQDVMDRIKFVKGDICDKKVVSKLMPGNEVVVNFAAESHVDRSITDPEVFVKTDVLGVFTLLEEARRCDVKKFVQISTDEVYGSTAAESFTEKSLLDPSSPYSASKAGGELLARSYVKTYGLNVAVTRSSNNYGPYQYPEKLIPVIIVKAMRDEQIPIYGKGDAVRDWLYVDDNCRGVDLVLRKGGAGEIFNIGGGNERTNLEVTRLILNYMNKPESLIKHVPERLGADFRYSLSWDRIRELGWKPIVPFEEGIKRTVDWYLNNQDWWRPLL